MNKYSTKYPILLFTGVLLSFWFLSCDKENLKTISVEKSFELPEEVLNRYAEALQQRPDGWEFGLATKNNAYFAGYLNFTENSQAQFTVNAFAPAQLSLRAIGSSLKTIGSNAVLSLSGEAYLQFMAGRSGIDSVFSFQAIRQDSIYLLGNQYGNQLILTPASSQKAQGYREGTIVNTLENIGKLALLPRYFKRLVINGAEYDLHFRPDVSTLYIHYGGTERFKIHETLYAPTATGVSLQKPLVDGINSISYLDALEVDLGAATLSAVTNGISRTFTNEYSPSAYDVTVAQKFFNNPPWQVNINYGAQVVTERYSASRTGFTVAGVRDAYGLGGISGYGFTLFIHQFAQQNYGALWFVINNSIAPYGPATIQQYSTTGGIVRFVYHGFFENPPADIATVIGQTAATFIDSNGFFVIPAGLGAYELVSLNVNGGQKWMRFE